jgi:exodeoxyribonuclease VII small subunit
MRQQGGRRIGKDPNMGKTTSPRPPEELNYEAAAKELEQVVSALEGEPDSLEQAIALFERGQALVKRCTELLDRAELQVKRLSGAGLVELEED